jgi:ABC-type Zn uptake system ZnuABC Zn-binding protein ZnuA
MNRCLRPLVAFTAIVAVACGGDGTLEETARTTQTVSPSALGIPDRSPTALELPISVAVTLSIFEDFARAGGLENVEVISLIPASADPHNYAFAGADIERMEGIDFFFFNSLGLDTRLQEAIEARRDKRAKVIPFAPNILSPGGGGLTAEQAGDNAHLWLDPSLAYVYTEIVADEFIIYDGIHEDFYTRAFELYRQRLLDLQAELEVTLEAIPPGRRKIVTFHDSFTHFSRRFGFAEVGFLVSDPSLDVVDSDVQRLASLVAEQSVPAVFAEFGYDAESMRQVANRATVPLCTLYTDIADVGMDYEELMRANAAELVRCLGS